MSTESGSDQQLLQPFVISGTDLSTEALAVALGLRHQYLVAPYSIPPDSHPLALTLKDKKPEPIITQPVVPIQEAPGAPVTVQLVGHRSRTTTTPGAPTTSATPDCITVQP